MAPAGSPRAGLTCWPEWRFRAPQGPASPARSSPAPALALLRCVSIDFPARFQQLDSSSRTPPSWSALPLCLCPRPEGPSGLGCALTSGRPGPPACHRPMPCGTGDRGGSVQARPEAVVDHDTCCCWRGEQREAAGFASSGGAPWVPRALHRAPPLAFPLSPAHLGLHLGCVESPGEWEGSPFPPSAAGTVPEGGRLGLSNPPPCFCPSGVTHPTACPACGRCRGSWGQAATAIARLLVDFRPSCSQRTSVFPGVPQAAAPPHVGPQDVQHLWGGDRTSSRFNTLSGFRAAERLRGPGGQLIPAAGRRQGPEGPGSAMQGRPAWPERAGAGHLALPLGC